MNTSVQMSSTRQYSDCRARLKGKTEKCCWSRKRVRRADIIGRQAVEGLVRKSIRRARMSSGCWMMGERRAERRSK